MTYIKTVTEVYQCDRCKKQIPSNAIVVTNASFRFPSLPELHLCTFCQKALRLWLNNYKKRRSIIK